MSVIEDTTTNTVSTSSEKSRTNSDSAITDEFRNLLTELAQRREDAKTAQTDSSKRGRSLFNQMNQDLNKITSNLEGFFTPDNKTYAQLHNAVRMFASSTGARSELLSSLSELSETNPVTAAGLVKDLIALQSTFTKAMQNMRGSSARVVYARVAFMKLNFQAQVSNYLGNISQNGNNQNAANTGNAFSSATRFSQLSLQMTLQQVTTSSSTDTATSLSAALDFSLHVTGSYNQTDMLLSVLDPIVLDLNGDGVDLRPVEDGVLFDLAGDGNEVRCGFVQGDDALLFLDENGDGFCTNGNELFGDQQGDANGFAELSKYDTSGDSAISTEDEVFSKLRVWNDWNGDGVSTEDEVRDLTEAGVESLSLQYLHGNTRSGGNEIAQTSFFTTLKGELRAAVDANFNYLQNNSIS